MAGEDGPGEQPSEVAGGRDPTSMSDAELRLLLSHPRLREKLRRLVAETTPTDEAERPVPSAAGDIAAIEPEPPVGSEQAAGDPVLDAEREGTDMAGAAAEPTEVSGAAVASVGSAVPEEALADYEEEGAP